jgi:hypothetical protein
MNYLDMFLRVVVAGVLGWAGAAKTRDLTSFAASLGQLLRRDDRQRVVRVGAGAVAGAEICTALLVIVPATATTGLLLAALLFGTFSIVAYLVRHRTVACACFGRTSANLGSTHAIRNAILAMAALTGVAIATGGSGSRLSVVGTALMTLAAINVAYLVVHTDELVQWRR